jgi:hypothetical protein
MIGRMVNRKDRSDITRLTPIIYLLFMNIPLLCCWSLPATGVLLLLSVAPLGAAVNPKVKAKSFAVSNKRLSLDNTTEFLVGYLGTPADVWLTPGKGFDYVKARKDSNILLHLRRIKDKYGEPPYTPEQVNDALGIDARSPKEVEDQKDPWLRMNGATRPYYTEKVDFAHNVKGQRDVLASDTFRGPPADVAEQIKKYPTDHHLPDDVKPWPNEIISLGPFVLRKSVAPVETDFWAPQKLASSKDLKTAEGAKISYSNDYLTKGNGAWDTEGALLWPVHIIETPYQHDKWSINFGPAVYWKVQEQEKAGASDINELRFSVPVSALWQPYASSTADTQVFLQAEPYYQTDTSFRGDILGATASVELRTGRFLGNYFQLIPHMNFLGKNSLEGRFRVKGLTDYSDVRTGSKYISRKEGSDWFQLGGEVSFDLALFPDSDLTTDPNLPAPLTASASYRFMDAVSGEGGYADLFKANVSFWFNQYTGLSVDYQRGQTPVADKDIDTLTIGLQLKF